MLSGKERAHLRAIANPIEAIVQVGKDGIGENLIALVGEALEAREIVKIKLLETAPAETREVSEQLCAALLAEPVQCIGKTVVLYRESTKNEKKNHFLKDIK